jgi:lysozyme family protein
VAVLSRTADPALGHVGFVVGWTDGRLMLLGGNQGDAVTVAAFDRRRLLGLRRPAAAMPEPAGAPPPAPSALPSADFDTALTHVLAMEGGWTDDPHDPGGPTNRGITLAVFADDRGSTVTPDTYDRLRGELRVIPDADVRRIYRERYWSRARAAELPAAIGLMHFDAAVNHGVGRAARFLQQAARVDVDGEIGPLTLSAVHSADQAALIARYAELRRQHYRSLTHFWRFGRGWLARVDKTLAAALRHDSSVLEQSRVAQETDPMADTTTSRPAPASETEAKWWGQSLTIWGAIVTAVSTVLPALAPLIGIEITADLVRTLGSQLSAAVSAIGGVVGTVMTIYGRARATTRIERRDVRLHL